MTPAEPGWEVQSAEFSAAGLLHDSEPSRTTTTPSPLARTMTPIALTNVDATSASCASRRGRRANGRRLLVSAGIALLGVFCLGLVTFHVLIAENQFTLDRLTQTAATEQASYEKLRLQVAQLEAPARIV